MRSRWIRNTAGFYISRNERVNIVNHGHYTGEWKRSNYWNIVVDGVCDVCRPTLRDAKRYAEQFYSSELGEAA